MTPKMNDANYVHLAGLTYLTMSNPDSPSVAAQCSGRIGWDWKNRSHPFVELYRGDSDRVAQAFCDEHNRKEHGR